MPDAVLQSMLDAMPDSYQKTIGFPTYDLLAGAAIPLNACWERLLAAEKKLDPANLTGAELDAYIYSRMGLARKAATFAEGVLELTGTGVVSEGDLFESSGGVQFAAIETVSIAGFGQVRVRCTQTGSIGNLPPGSVVMMPLQIAGIVSVSNSDTLTDGYEAESDADYYARFLMRLQTPPTSGNQYHYRNWALEVPGVGGVQVYPLGHGNYTVDVVLIDETGKPASASLVKQVQNHIDPESKGIGEGEAPIGAHCYVSAAERVDLTISVTIMRFGDREESAVTEAVKAAVDAYLGRIAFQQDFVSYAQIAAAILAAEGVQDYEGLLVNGGMTNLQIGVRQVAVLGKVEITYAA